MDKGLIKKGEYNEAGDKIISSMIVGVQRITKLQYGVIRIIGEKQERRVPYKSLFAINQAKPEDEITLVTDSGRIVVSRARIVFQETREEEIREDIDSIAKKPSEQIPLTLDMLIWSEAQKHIRSWIEKQGVAYYLATCHYDIVKDEDGVEVKSYYIERNQIEELLLMKPQPDGYPHAVAGVWRYGNLQEFIPLKRK